MWDSLVWVSSYLLVYELDEGLYFYWLGIYMYIFWTCPRVSYRRARKNCNLFTHSGNEGIKLSPFYYGDKKLSAKGPANESQVLLNEFTFTSRLDWNPPVRFDSDSFHYSFFVLSFFYVFRSRSDEARSLIAVGKNIPTFSESCRHLISSSNRYQPLVACSF